MAEFEFPEKRFKSAKATTEELDVLRQEFNASDLTIQRSLHEFWKGQPASGLRDYLTRERSNGRFQTEVKEVAKKAKPKKEVSENPVEPDTDVPNESTVPEETPVEPVE